MGRGEGRWPGLLRRLRRGALLSAVLLIVAACSGGNLLNDSGPTEPRGRTVPPISVAQVMGLPPGKLADLKTALAVAGGQHDIGIVEGSFQSGTFQLTGDFRTFAENSGVRIVYQWQLRDGDGVLIQTIDGEDNAGLPTGPDPWSAVSTSVLDRIARRTAESMAAKLGQMGYATRLSKLSVPPAEYFARAGPDAHREIDFETLNGPGFENAGLDMSGPVAGTALAANETAPEPSEDDVAKGAAVAEDQKPDQAVADADPAPAPDAAKTAPKGKVAIRAVAVVPVKGSPGPGDAELTAAMRRTLAEAGWPVVSKPQPDAITIVGKVQVAKKGGPQQAVQVSWVVKTPDGKMLGDVKQANQVPSGALDKGWGQAAAIVAQAAAPGIFDIVQRFR